MLIALAGLDAAYISQVYAREEIVWFINSVGGMSVLEMSAVVELVRRELGKPRLSFVRFLTD